MKFFKLGLLTLLISLFILGSCKNQDGIGLGVEPGNQLDGSLIADTNLIITNVLEDSSSTNGLLRTPLAYFKDPEFGVTESNIAAQLTLPGRAAYTLTDSAIVVDSVVLVMPYAEGFYGDSLTSKFKLDVHQLNEKYEATTYYNTKTWDYNSALLATKTFVARPHDTIKVTSIVDGAADTLIKVRPQLRMPFSTAFINNQLLRGAPAANRASTLAFQNSVKGLYFTLDKAGTTGPGGNLMFQMDSTRIDIYMRVGTKTIDTTIVTVPVSQHMASVKHTYSANVQAALNKTSTDGLIYLQGLAGLRAKIEFPDLKNKFAALGSNVIVNRAEIVVTARTGSTIPYRPLDKLTLYQLDLAKQRIRIQDADLNDPRGGNGPTYFGGYYNKANNEYHFLVTGYIQDLLKGKTVDYGTYLAPVDPASSTTVNINPVLTYAERTIISGKNSPSRVKLNIIYTKINQ